MTKTLPEHPVDRIDPMFLAREFRDSKYYGRLRDQEDDLWIFLDSVLHQTEDSRCETGYRFTPYAPNPTKVAGVKRALKALEANELHESGGT